MWWRRFDIDAVDESQILRSLVVTTRRLFTWVVFFTSSIFSSLTDIDMSLIFFVDRLWLLEEMLSREWKLYTTTFLITQRSNIVWTASNWDLLTLLTSIWTQNRIKRFVVDITYRWISLSVDSDSKENVTIIAMKINWELDKRLRELTLVITHYEELKELIAKMKYLIDVATENWKCHEKIYKVYSDSQTSLKTVKVMISTKDQTRLQRVQIMHESI